MQFANHSPGTNNYHPERKHCRFLCVRNEKHSYLHTLILEYETQIDEKNTGQCFSIEL